MTAPEDPFVAHLDAVHAGSAWRPFDGAARDWVRENVDECDRCRELVEAFDVAMSRALIAGTGPFA